MDADKVVSYPFNKLQFMAKDKGWGAVKQIDEYMSDPVVCKRNGARYRLSANFTTNVHHYVSVISVNVSTM